MINGRRTFDKSFAYSLIKKGCETGMEREKLKPEEVKVLYEIYMMYGNFIFATGLKILRDFQLAEDCLQEVLLKLGEKSIGKMESFSEERRKWYIYAVAKNTALNMLKKRKREIPDREPEIKLEQEKRFMQEEFLIKGSYGFTDDMDVYLEGLNSIDREILGLKYSEDLTNQEIAQKLNKPIQIIAQRASRARKKLEKAIEKKDEPE